VRAGCFCPGPGSVLLGNAGTCFECRHEHGSGDRCLCFHFTPETLGDVARHVPGVTSAAFRTPVLQPSPRLIPLIAALESASEPAELEELGLRIAAHALSGPDRRPRTERVRRRDEKLVCDTVHSIERRSEDTLHVADLAAEAGVSTYRFLRLFARVVGMTPYQYLLRTRLHRAAVRIRCTRLPIARIAFEAGFNDLSTFNDRFRRTMGMSPRAYRLAR
jgi:AraC family transcriptional regulator